MPPGVISPTNQDWLKTAGNVPTTYAPGLTPLNAPGPVQGDTNGMVNGTATSAADAAAKAANDDYWRTQGQLVDDQMNRLPNQAAIGKQNILDAYNSAFSTLTNQKATGERDYNTARNNTVQDNIVAKDRIAGGVRNQLTGAQRLFGSRGAGNSSAAEILAPYAAGRLGNNQRAEVQSTFGRNVGALDTGWSDALNSFTSGFGNLLADKTNRERSLDAGVAKNKSDLLSQKARIAASLGQPIDPTIASQIHDLGGQIDQLGATQTFTPPTVDAKPADTSAYDYTRYNAPSAGVNPAQAQNLGAFWTLLTGKDKQKANPVGV